MIILIDVIAIDFPSYGIHVELREKKNLSSLYYEFPLFCSRQHRNNISLNLIVFYCTAAVSVLKTTPEWQHFPYRVSTAGSPSPVTPAPSDVKKLD